MEKWLDVAAALLAIIAAVFWFLSAYGKLPPMVAYWGKTPESDPYYEAVKFSAVMNRWAAGFSGASALSMAARLFIGKS
jgi:Na+/proline symporter